MNDAENIGAAVFFFAMIALIIWGVIAITKWINEHSQEIENFFLWVIGIIFWIFVIGGLFNSCSRNEEPSNKPINYYNQPACSLQYCVNTYNLKNHCPDSVIENYEYIPLPVESDVTEQINHFNDYLSNLQTRINSSIQSTINSGLSDNLNPLLKLLNSSSNQMKSIEQKLIEERDNINKLRIELKEERDDFLSYKKSESDRLEEEKRHKVFEAIKMLILGGLAGWLLNFLSPKSTERKDSIVIFKESSEKRNIKNPIVKFIYIKSKSMLFYIKSCLINLLDKYIPILVVTLKVLIFVTVMDYIYYYIINDYSLFPLF